MRRAIHSDADVVHGHGAKGGAYARLIFGHAKAVRAYTPHGGSLLFSHDDLLGKFYLASERLLMLRGDLFLFESAYSADVFRRKIGTPTGLVRIVHNGVAPADFAPTLARNNATDLVFIGELRPVKGVDILIEAIALLRREGRAVTATLVGSGPQREALEAQVTRLGLSSEICFRPAMPGQAALALGRIMVVPSRAESLPYVVLEAAAAGKPLITTSVGGIPEIYGPLSDRLVPPEDSPALARAIAAALDDPAGIAETTRQLREQVANSFTVAAMVDGVVAGYCDALARLQKAGRR
jgi:glycosyltransferase involved in cell wall biosynthesis